MPVPVDGTPRTFREVGILLRQLMEEVDEIKKKQNLIFNLLITSIVSPIIVGVVVAVIVKGIT